MGIHPFRSPVAPLGGGRTFADVRTTMTQLTRDDTFPNSVAQQLAAGAQQQLNRSASEILNQQAMMSSSVAWSTPFAQAVFGDASQIPVSKYEKRLKKWRKKHPEEADCFDKMYKKAYKEVS